jgi:hypothetical protein
MEPSSRPRRDRAGDRNSVLPHFLTPEFSECVVALITLSGLEEHNESQM